MQNLMLVFHDAGMEKKSITTAEAGRRGGQSTLKKYGKRRMCEWGKFGGRSRKKKPTK